MYLKLSEEHVKCSSVQWLHFKALYLNKSNFKAQINTVVMVMVGSFSYVGDNFKEEIKKETFRQTFVSIDPVYRSTKWK
jgi:hypothetical protein